MQKHKAQGPFKNYKKCFLFHQKSSFRSRDIQILKNVFYFIKKALFVCNFFPSFPHFPDSKGQMEVE